MILAEETPNIVVNATVAVVQNSSNATAQALAMQQEMLDMLNLMMGSFLMLASIGAVLFLIMNILDNIRPNHSSYHYSAASNQDSQQHMDMSVNQTAKNKVVVADISNPKDDIVSHEEEPRSRWDSLEI